MKITNRTFLVSAIAISSIVTLTACSGSSDDSSGGGSGKTEITLLTDSSETAVKAAEAVIAAFEKDNPTITVKPATRPGGTDGDNVVKTKLSTDDMEDVFWYNSGSLLAALSPEKTLLDLTGTDALKDTDPAFLPAVTQNGKVYGAPQGTAMGGGILYNKKVYADLGLTVPKSWAEFEANNDKIKAAGIAPLIGSFKDTWTTQLFILGDFYNVQKKVPDWATLYTANKVNYSSEPALAGFQKLQESANKDWYIKGAGSTTFDQGMALLSAGKGAQYPMLTFPIAGLKPEQGKNIGFFGIPGDDPSTAGATIWMPSGQYIPKTSKHPEEAKKFAAFVASPAGVAAVDAVLPPAGPWLVKGAPTPPDALPVVGDINSYISGGNNSPALEFLSPVKGPALEKITASVATGQTDAAEAAKQYDADVTKQAKQLGLPGW